MPAPSPAPAGAPPPGGVGARRRAGRGAAAAVLLVGAVGLALLLPPVRAALTGALAGLRDGLAALGPWGPPALAAALALATLLMLPGAPFGVLAGAAFGLGTGVLATFAGAVAGATGALLLTRRLLRPAVERRLAGHARLEALDALLARRGAWVALLLRLSPLLPYNLLNHALGLTRLRVSASLVGCLGMLPGTFLYVGAGAAAGAAAQAPPGPERLALLLAGLLATLALVLVLGRAARRALAAPAPEEAQRAAASEAAPGAGGVQASTENRPLSR